MYFLNLIPGPTSHHLPAIHMIILRDEKEGQREIQMMILEERDGDRDGCCHRCAPTTPQRAVCAHVVVHARACMCRCVCLPACVCMCGNMRIDAEAWPPLPLSFPFSHFSSFQSRWSHCGSTREQFVLIRSVLNETGEQSMVGINFHITAVRGEGRRSGGDEEERRRGLCRSSPHNYCLPF